MSSLGVSIGDSPASQTERVAARLTRSLPLALEAEVSSVIADWDAHPRVGRIRARDITPWTDGNDSFRRDRPGAVADQSADDDCFSALQDDLRPHRFEDAVLLGSGALSVFAEVLSLTFPSTDADLPRLRVLDSTDPQQLAALEHELVLDRTLFFVSSRSGITLEPYGLASYFFARLSGLLGVEEAGRRFIAITDTGSPLQVLAERRGYRQILHGPATVGGCSSALSDFGTLPAAACGIDVTTLLDRGERMADACAECVPGVDNPGLVLGAIIGACATRGRDKLTLLTSPGLRPFGAWLEQLLAGSTGKGVIPVDREPLGAFAAYGEDRLFVCLRLAGEGDDAQNAGVQALQDGGQPVVRIELANRFDVGAETIRWDSPRRSPPPSSASIRVLSPTPALPRTDSSTPTTVRRRFPTSRRSTRVKASGCSPTSAMPPSCTTTWAARTDSPSTWPRTSASSRSATTSRCWPTCR